MDHRRWQRRSIAVLFLLGLTGCDGLVEDYGAREDTNLGRTPSCVVDPASPLENSDYVVQVVGHRSDSPIALTLTDTGGVRSQQLETDQSGQASFTFASTEAGPARAVVTTELRGQVYETASCAFDISPAAGCGDGACAADEACSSCSSDCGACPSTTASPDAGTQAPVDAGVNCGDASALQSKIAAAPSGSVLDLTGCTYTAGAVIDKPLTLRGASVLAPPKTAGLTATSDDVTIDGVTVVGAQATTYAGAEKCVAAIGTSTDKIERFLIKNSSLRRCGYGGVYVWWASQARVSANVIEDSVHAGVLFASVDNSRIDGNTIRRTGVYGGGANSWNAYAIGVTYQSGGTMSTDVVVENNTIEEVPTWHGLDTHGGVRITFRNNTVRGARRAIFLTTRPTDVVVDGNELTAPTPAQQAACQAVTDGRDPAYCTDVNGISIYGGSGSITNNVGHGWPTSGWWNPVLGGNYTFGGNLPNIP